MKGPRLLAVLVSLTTAHAQEAAPAQPDYSHQKGIQDGTLVPGSLSPDGAYGLYEFFFWDGPTKQSETSASAVGLAHADRSLLLGTVYSHTEWSTDKKVTTFLTFKWNAASNLLATHDSLEKHSQLHVYRIPAKDRMLELIVPDLLALAARHWGLDGKAIVSSGQTPLKWTADDALEIEIRARTAKGERSARISLKAGNKDCTATLVEKR